MKFALENPPTIGAAAAAFWVALVGWALDAVAFPTEVEATGGVFVAVAGIYIIGRVTQKFTDPKPRA